MICPSGWIKIGEFLDDDHPGVLRRARERLDDIVKRTSFETMSKLKFLVPDHVDHRLTSGQDTQFEAGLRDATIISDGQSKVVEKEGNETDTNENVIDTNENVIDTNENVVDTNENVIDTNENVVDAKTKGCHEQDFFKNGSINYGF